MAKLSNVKGTKGIIKATLTFNELFLISLPTYWGQQIKKLSSGEKTAIKIVLDCMITKLM